MAHGEAVQPLESVDGSAVKVKDGEIFTRDRHIDILEEILLEVRRTNEYLEHLFDV